MFLWLWVGWTIGIASYSLGVLIFFEKKKKTETVSKRFAVYNNKGFIELGVEMVLMGNWGKWRMLKMRKNREANVYI